MPTAVKAIKATKKIFPMMGRKAAGCVANQYLKVSKFIFFRVSYSANRVACLCLYCCSKISRLRQLLTGKEVLS